MLFYFVLLYFILSFLKEWRITYYNAKKFMIFTGGRDVTNIIGDKAASKIRKAWKRYKVNQKKL